MVMGYYRLGRYDDARRSMQQLIKFAREFRMDNPLVDFGAAVYQPNQPVNLCYDSFGPPAAMIRGLFEYLYQAEGLVLLPHIPPGIKRLEQRFPIRFGAKRLYLATAGSGPVTAVEINGQTWPLFDQRSITLPYDDVPPEAMIQIGLGGTRPAPPAQRSSAAVPTLPEAVTLSTMAWNPEQSPGSTNIDGKEVAPEKTEPAPGLAEMDAKIAGIRRFYQALAAAGLAESYEAAHARLAVEFAAATCARLQMLSEGAITRLPGPSQDAADRSYLSTTAKLCEGLEQTIQSYKDSENSHQQQVYRIWIGKGLLD